MPLSLSGNGEPRAIRRVGGSGEVKKRLSAMGFTVGSVVTVVSCLAGNLIVNVRDSRVAVSRELACKIFV
ncbi:MAG: iron transporter FeoA [Treponematales bacterium]